jgi:formate hydrogenlyase subunit 3/multisubunit Na+/H+ antiporter MnhD subunit
MSAITAAAQNLGPALLALTLAAPVAILAACLSPNLRPRAQALATLAPLPALAAACLAVAGGGFAFELPALRLNLRLDAPGAMLLAAAAIVWICAGVFAAADMRQRPNSARFAVAWLLTLTGSLGVFIAADLLTFYLVYALVSIPAYYLVADDGDAGSVRAGGVYLAFALLGEAFLLIAFVVLAAGEPHGSVQIADVVASLAASPWRDAAIFLLIAGFGMKIALVPLHGWMPLAYTAAPIPAAAALSGAAVKAGVIGLIRFLPFAAGAAGFGEALVWLGFISAFYGVALGLTQTNPKTVLAYSSISQMGVIAAVLGMGLAMGDASAPGDAAFYAMNHVLVKAALFLTIGVAATAGGRLGFWSSIVAAVLALSLAGLPLTGGALAKLAVKAPLGDGLASVAATISAVGTTLLMLHFLVRLAASRTAGAAPSRARLIPWIALAAAAILVPWLMLPAVGGSVADAVSPAKLWDSLWPLLVGAALAFGLRGWAHRLPQIPAGDIVASQEAAFRATAPLLLAFERIDAAARQWPVAGLSLLTIALALAAAFAAR